MQNMNQLMRQAKKMQDEIMKAQEALGAETVEGSAGGGVVKAVMSGHKEIQSILIDKSVVDPEDVEMLQDLLVVALQDAMAKVDALSNERMGKYTRALNMPGMF